MYSNQTGDVFFLTCMLIPHPKDPLLFFSRSYLRNLYKYFGEHMELLLIRYLSYWLHLVHADLINVDYLYQVMTTLHFLNGVSNDAESTQKSIVTS